MPPLDSDLPPPADETPSSGDGASERTPTDDGHISFVERLQRRYGKDVDPRIDLQDELEESAALSSRQDSSHASSSSRDLLKRLRRQFGVSSRYEIRGEVARGGMGTILNIWDGELRRKLAMKVMHGPGGYDEESGISQGNEEKLQRFLEEAQITGQLDHPGVVPVHEMGIDRHGRCYFTMRLVRGKELKEVLDEAREGTGKWTITRAVGVVLKVCEAMHYAHTKGVIHRDLKPTNVMVGGFGETYVMDWGLARIYKDPPEGKAPRGPSDGGSSVSLVRTVRKEERDANPDSHLVTMDGDVVGTPAYMALEQAQGKLDELGPTSDVYSLGTILYYLLTGRSPYVEPGERVSPHTVLNRVLSDPPVAASKLAKGMPGELVAICEKAMERDAADRYRDMEEVRNDLQAFLDDRVVGAYEGGAFAEFRKWVLRNRKFAAALAGLVVLALAAALTFGYLKDVQLDELTELDVIKDAALKDKDAALEEAQKSRELAEEQREIANSQRDLAAKNERAARESEEIARLSGYQGSILAADSHFRLGDVEQARRRLAECAEDLRGWEWQHLMLHGQAALQTKYFGGQAAVDAVAFSPRERRVALLTRGGRFRLLDLESGAFVSLPKINLQLDILRIGPMFPLSMDFSSDGEQVLLAGRDHVIRVFDLIGGEEVARLPESEGVTGHEAGVSAARFSPNRRRIASGSGDGMLIVWDARTRNVLQRLPGHGSDVTGLDWAPDSIHLVSSSTDGTARIWNTATGASLSVLKGHAGVVHDVAWGPAGRRIATAGADRNVNLWDAMSGRLTQSLSGHHGQVLAVDFDPSSTRLVSGSEDRTLRVWDPERAESIVLLGHEDPVLTVAFSADGREILSGADDGTFKLWDSRGDLSDTRLEGSAGAVIAVAARTEEPSIATSDSSGGILLWDSRSGYPQRRLVGHDGVVTALAFSPDGRTLLSAAADGEARLWDLASGRARLRLRGSGKGILDAVWAEEGTRVVTGSTDKLVRVFDAETGEELRVLEAHRFSVTAVAASADGRLLASAGQKIHLWDAESDEPRLTLPGPRRKERALAFSPDGRQLVSVSKDSVTRIWDTATGTLLHELRDHDDEVTAVVFSPDGSRFVTASEDQRIRVREANRGETILELRGHAGTVHALAFDPRGIRLVSGGEDGLARVWETGEREDRRRRWAEETAWREEAIPLVDELFDEHLRLGEVLRAIEQERDLDDEVRGCALGLARLRGDEPELLIRSCAEVVARPGLSREAYATAHRQASAAVDIDPFQARYRLIAGEAEVRVEAFRDAVETLREAERIDLLTGDERSGPHLSAAEEVTRRLFLAMAYHGIGDVGEARDLLESSRVEMEESPSHQRDSSLLRLLDEATTRIGARGE